jgi:hypothetical protein
VYAGLSNKYSKIPNFRISEGQSWKKIRSLFFVEIPEKSMSSPAVIE